MTIHQVLCDSEFGDLFIGNSYFCFDIYRDASNLQIESFTIVIAAREPSAAHHKRIEEAHKDLASINAFLKVFNRVIIVLN